MLVLDHAAELIETEHRQDEDSNTAIAQKMIEAASKRITALDDYTNSTVTRHSTVITYH